MMGRNSDERKFPRLEVYLNQSILIQPNGTKHVFKEGSPTSEAQNRLERIRKEFDSGFLTKAIEDCRRPDVPIELLDAPVSDVLTRLVNSVTSEVGRALVGLTVLQLAIKAIAPDQSIRLHKGGGRGESFSWIDGIPMRVLDKQYNTPALRAYGLLRLNADGVFMTRSLAENYPYSKLYKAAIRGARPDWLEIIDMVEDNKFDPLTGLKHVLRMLLNRSEMFRKMSIVTMSNVKAIASRISSLEEAVGFVSGFVESTTYSARVFEIAMHSFFQVLEDQGTFTGYLKPLSQMRSANKKHGNIGDIEITTRQGGFEILESWDAKYGKPYLRDELEELSEKLQDHSETEVAGFVVDGQPNLKAEIIERTKELELVHNVSIYILSFEDWVQDQAKRTSIAADKLSENWIVAFGESLCQLRRERAPIDEPCDTWVSELEKYSRAWS